MAGPSGGGLGRPNPLPYELLAGVVPTKAGWVVASAKLQGIQIYPNEPELLSNITDVLDYRPSFKVIALNAPVGLPEQPIEGGRRCDREARKLIGFPRAGAIPTPPVRGALSATSYEEAARMSGGMGAVTWGLLSRYAELDAEMASYRQRTVFEVQPELSFFQLNEDKPMQFSKRSHIGMEERKDLLKARIPGIERIVDAELAKVKPWQLIDAAVCLWTTRRIMSRAMTRIPEDPEWDDTGLRMELVR
jgi:predicted RNase H-like nuclease